MRAVLHRWFSTIAKFIAVLSVAGCGGGGTEPPGPGDHTVSALSATPALSNPGVCDPLKAPGTTSGLLGICVAYCQALQCPNASAGATAMSKQCKAADPTLLATYNKLKKAGDPAMPCVQPPTTCPCWTQQEIANVGFAFTPHLVDLFPNVFDAYSSTALVENRVATDSFPYGGYQVVQVDQTAVSNTCYYFNFDFAPGAPEGIVRVQTISQAEASSCLASIDAQVSLLQTSGVQVTCTGNQCPFIVSGNSNIRPTMSVRPAMSVARHSH